MTKHCGCAEGAHLGSARTPKLGVNNRAMPSPAPGSKIARKKKANITISGSGIRILLSRPMECAPLTTPKQTAASTSA
eukprot:scaffold202958_cov33-Tisochrysis_lutea.AAC.4